MNSLENELIAEQRKYIGLCEEKISLLENLLSEQNETIEKFTELINIVRKGMENE